MTDETEILKECRIDIYRAGTVQVRITHLPTGLVGEAVHGVSQHKAKQLAMEALLKQLPERRGCSDAKD